MIQLLLVMFSETIVKILAIGLVIFWLIGMILPPRHDSTLSNTMLSYEQLKNYPKDCSKLDVNLSNLKALQQSKGFNEDPDELTDEDRAYNALLKETIWWYRRECDMI
jgi:hypothetical protein